MGPPDAVGIPWKYKRYYCISVGIGNSLMGMGENESTTFSPFCRLQQVNHIYTV